MHIHLSWSYVSSVGAETYKWQYIIQHYDQVIPWLNTDSNRRSKEERKYRKMAVGNSRKAGRLAGCTPTSCVWLFCLLFWIHYDWECIWLAPLLRTYRTVEISFPYSIHSGVELSLACGRFACKFQKRLRRVGGY